MMSKHEFKELNDTDIAKLVLIHGPNNMAPGKLVYFTEEERSDLNYSDATISLMKMNRRATLEIIDLSKISITGAATMIDIDESLEFIDKMPNVKSKSHIYEILNTFERLNKVWSISTVAKHIPPSRLG